MTMTTDIVRELLDYDPETGEFTWRERGLHWFSSGHSCRAWNGKHAGKVAGSKFGPAWGANYIGIRINRKGYLAHRLAFLWMGEEVPEQVDHDDHDGMNNAWSNLIATTHKGNGQNQSMHRNNSSGVTGVCWHKAAGKWIARVRSGKKTVHLGLFHEDDLDLAAMEVMEFRVDMGYNIRHGIEPTPWSREHA